MTNLAKTLSKGIKNNISVIAFFAVIFFGGFSIWSNSQESATKARELIEYTKNTVFVVDKTFSDLNLITNLVPNDEQRYDLIASELKNFSRKLSDFASQIPNKNTDGASVRLESGLRDFLLTIKKETVEPLTQRIELQRPLIEKTLIYGGLQRQVKTGSYKDLKLALEAGLEVVNTQVSIAGYIKDNAIQNEKLQVYQEDIKRLQTGLKAIEIPLQKSEALNTKLTSDEKSQLENIFDGNWPIEDPLFPTIRIEDLKTKLFASDLNTLQSYVNDLAKQYKL